MKIATFNIGEDERNEGNLVTKESYDKVVKSIKENNIDVICLQEAIIKSKKLENSLKYISEHTDLKYVTYFELSPSHINIGSTMGLGICSKFEISNIKHVEFENPTLVKKGSERIYKSHNKGYIKCVINNYNLITTHFLPFHIFDRDILMYKYIFENIEKDILDSKNIIALGDFNYENIFKLLKVQEKVNDIITEPTSNNKKIDHILVDVNINVKSSKVKKLDFDHNLCIVEI